jgi:hypothetical protein
MRATTADGGPPPPVFLALLGSYALAALLIGGGLLGLLTWAALGEPAGAVSLVLGLLVLGATYVAWRGSRTGRAVLSLLAAIGAVAGVAYMFAGPNSAFIPSLVVAALGAGTLALLYLPEAAKRFYAAG